MYANSTAGGFMNTNELEDTPGKGKVRRLQSVVPLVIKQIKSCEDDELNLFGMPVQILSLVAIITDYEVQTTKAIYNIEDFSGSIKALWWLESDNNAAKLPMVKENNYVRIYGSLRVQDGEKIVMVLRMFPVDDCNIVMNHLLQVIHARLQAEHIANNPAGSTSIIKKNNPGAELANSMQYIHENNQDANLTSIQKMVLEALKKDNDSLAGISKQKLLGQFPSNKHTDVLEALEFLQNEGHAYSTVDSDHFKLTVSM